MTHQKLYKQTRFTDKTVIVTGGGTGIGKQVAKDLHAEGASVHILGRRLEKLEESKGEADLDGDRFFCHQCDISDHRRVREVFDRVMKASGPVYGLVNNAAINPSRNDILNTDLEDWTATMEVNLTGAFNCCKAAVEQMLARGGGSIVNIYFCRRFKGVPHPYLL